MHRGTTTSGRRTSATRRTLLTGMVLALLFGVTSTAHAGPSSAGPYNLSFRNCADEHILPGFTIGPSVDGGKKAITLDGANCFGPNPNPNAIASVSFHNYWEQELIAVQQLKMSTLGPFTQGGSPRIEIILEDNVGDPPNGHVVELNPPNCGKANGAGWVNSDFRHGWDCTVFYSDGVNPQESFTGTKAHKVNGINVPAVSAWDYMVQAHPGERIWHAYAIADEPTVNRIDKIQLDAQVFTNDGGTFS